MLAETPFLLEESGGVPVQRIEVQILHVNGLNIIFALQRAEIDLHFRSRSQMSP